MAAHELGATVGAWNALVRRTRMADRQKLAALVVSSYADTDGTGIHCGVTRLAVDLGASYRTAQRYLAWLREVGLIELVREGNRRKRLSDEYRLIIGPDVLEHLEVLAPDTYEEARTDMREARTKRNQATPKNDAQSAPESVPTADDQASPKVSSKTSDQASNGAPSGVTLGVPPPTSNTSPSRSTSPTTAMADLRTAVTGPRASPDRKPAPVVALFPDSANAPDEKPYRALSPWRSGRRDFAADNLSEASARRRAAEAAHQAQLAADAEVS
jgi:DNA-binding transcriptional ArsR family regulator